MKTCHTVLPCAGFSFSPTGPGRSQLWHLDQRGQVVSILKTCLLYCGTGLHQVTVRCQKSEETWHGKLVQSKQQVFGKICGVKHKGKNICMKTRGLIWQQNSQERVWQKRCLSKLVKQGLVGSFHVDHGDCCTTLQPFQSFGGNDDPPMGI